MRIALALTVLLLAVAAEAAETEFLFDTLHRPAYHAAWERLLKQVQPTPDWLVQFSKNYDGVAGESVAATIDGKSYMMSFVCKPGDCAGHRFVVLFDPGGARAFGALGGKDNSPAFFGGPNGAEQEAMTKAVKG